PTWTVGGARLGNCAIGSVGIETAPPRMMSRAHTVAKIGRLMKKSTNIDLLASLDLRVHRHSVRQHLRIRNYDLVPWLQAIGDNIVIAIHWPHLDLTLMSNALAAAILRDIHEELSSDPG